MNTEFNYLVSNFLNISPNIDYWKNYEKLKNEEFKDLNTPYDYTSIMHYPDMNPQAIDKSKPTMKGIKGKIDQNK
jgi:hypothetical protein